ncbi:hypothetical protein GCM10009744_54120 [Kribbella alba]|uniref:Uncharacterized protein n=1 Tax=Kribbella alba TaxID=190197 RepID=A0ABN2FNG7_9ACTN
MAVVTTLPVGRPRSVPEDDDMLGYGLRRLTVPSCGGVVESDKHVRRRPSGDADHEGPGVD